MAGRPNHPISQMPALRHTATRETRSPPRLSCPLPCRPVCDPSICPSHACDVRRPTPNACSLAGLSGSTSLCSALKSGLSPCLDRPSKKEAKHMDLKSLPTAGGRDTATPLLALKAAFSLLLLSFFCFSLAHDPRPPGQDGPLGSGGNVPGTRI